MRRISPIIRIKAAPQGTPGAAGNFTNISPSVAVNDFVQYNEVAGNTGKSTGLQPSTDGTLSSNSDTKIPTEKAVKTYAIPNSAIDTDGTLAANSDTKLASQKAIKTYADAKVPKNSGGWEEAETWTYSSADGATGVFNVASDVTGKYSPGMRYKYTQDQALTAYWTFNADSTSQVGSFNGTDTSMTYTAGKFGNAATFNGTTSKIVIADNTSLKPTGEFTIGMWIKTSETGQNNALFQSYSANTNEAGFLVAINTSNTITFQIGNNTGSTLGTNFVQVKGNTNITDNSFHYVVVSYRNNYGQIYVDGKLDGSGYQLTPAYAATNYVRVGVNNNSGSDVNFFDGQIDDLFLINGYALDEKTIKAKYDAQTAQGTGAITVQKYGLITAVGAYSGSVTPITIWGGTDYSTANATISSPFYSVQKAPFGFPLNPAKWTVEVTDSIIRNQNLPSANTWYNIASISISVPIGYWSVSYNACLYSNRSASTSTGPQRITLSKTSNGSTDDDLISGQYAAGATGNIAIISAHNKSKFVMVYSKTTYYLNALTQNSADSDIGIRGDIGMTIIRAVCAYL